MENFKEVMEYINHIMTSVLLYTNGEIEHVVYKKCPFNNMEEAERAYKLHLERKKAREEMAVIKRVLNNTPYRDLVRRKYIKTRCIDVELPF